ncbi:MAG: ABC transporter ATP-binding protein [Gemmataceae bacterium]
MGDRSSVIETQHLQKSYGHVQALKGVSVTVGPGQIYGLLGQNGAGKSTLIKILLGIVRKSGGDATLLGEPTGHAQVRKRVGYLPEDHQFPLYHSAGTLLDFYGQLYGLSRADRQRKAEEALEIVGIRTRMNDKIKTYSKGMKQRVGIAQAFFHDPDVIFLDEPTDGVDPVGRKEIRDLLMKLKSEGRTIFINSHLLGEVEMICDRVAILHRGQMVREGTVADLTKQDGRFIVGLAPGQSFPTEEISRLGFGLHPVGERYEITVGSDHSAIDQVLSFLSEKGYKIRHLVEKKQTLEDVFVDMVDTAEPGTDDRQTRRARPIGKGVGR